MEPIVSLCMVGGLEVGLAMVNFVCMPTRWCHRITYFWWTAPGEKYVAVSFPVGMLWFHSPNTEA